MLKEANATKVGKGADLRFWGLGHMRDGRRYFIFIFLGERDWSSGTPPRRLVNRPVKGPTFWREDPDGSHSRIVTCRVVVQRPQFVGQHQLHFIEDPVVGGPQASDTSG